MIPTCSDEENIAASTCLLKCTAYPQSCDDLLAMVEGDGCAADCPVCMKEHYINLFDGCELPTGAPTPTPTPAPTVAATDALEEGTEIEALSGSLPINGLVS